MTTQTQEAESVRCLATAMRPLRGTNHARAARCWRHDIVRAGVDPDRALHLATCWCHINEACPDIAAQTAYVWLSALAKTSIPTNLPPRAVRAGARVVSRYPRKEVLQSLVDALSCSEPSDYEAAVCEVARTCRAADAERARAAVGFESMLPILEPSVAMFSPRSRLLRLESMRCAPWAPTASTDGQAIRLPERIAVSARPEINEWAYVCLLAHETAHIESGTFRFSFRNEAGQEVWRRLEPRRPVFKLRRRLWIQQRRKQRRDRQGWSLRTRLPDLHAFCMHFPEPRAAYGLFNAVEDRRIERLLFARFGGLLGPHRSWEAAAARLAPEPLLESLEDNFARAVLTLLTGRRHRGYVGSHYQAAWDAVRRTLQAHDHHRDTSVEAAVLLAVELYELLSDTLPSSAWMRLELHFEEIASLPADEVVTRLGALSAEVYDPARAIPWSFVDLPEIDPAMPGPWRSFDEYNIWRNRFEPRASRVRERRWQPVLQAQPFDLQLPVASPPPPVRAMSGGHRRSRRWDDEGVEADMMRVHDLVASHRAGYAADDRVFFQPRGQASRLLISIVIDLSASMRANRAPRQSDLAFHRAQRLAHRWTNAWQRHIPIGVFGGWDTGRRSVTMHVLKDWSERYLPSRLLSLHTMGMGGFRLGAMVRYLSWRGERVARGAQHVVVLLTDSASHYLARGLDRALAHSHPPKGCMRCDHMETCSIEPCVPRVNGSGQLKHHGLYYPTFYELADLRQALLTSPQVTPALVLLDDFYDETAVRRQLPRGDSVVVRRAEEASNADRVLRTILRRVSM